MQKLRHRARRCREANDSEDLEEDTEDVLDLRSSRSADVTIPYSCKSGDDKVHGQQVLIRPIIRHVGLTRAVLVFHPGSLVVVEECEEDPEASKDVYDKERCYDKEEQALEALTELQDVLGISQELALVFDDLNNPDQPRKLDQLVDPSELGDTRQLVAICCLRVTALV